MISDKNKKIEELHKAQQVIQPIIEKQINTFELLLHLEVNIILLMLLNYVKLVVKNLMIGID
jgi:hypothetical protein